MSYAVRNDGQGWRAVSGLEDLAVEEWYCIGSPPDPVPLPPALEELTDAVRETRHQLLAAAANHMGPLQDAIDEEIATDLEVEKFKRWRQYRIALNRIEQQAGFPVDIDWPISPDASSAP